MNFNQSRWAIPLLLTLAVLAAYRPAVQGEFLWDDGLYVSQNEVLQEKDGLIRIWMEPKLLPNYYPLVFSSFWFEYRLWGQEPGGYHLTNILLHALNSLLAYLLFRIWKTPAALFIAAVFALHPVHVESVAWIAERKDVLSSSFFLGAMCCWSRLLQQRREGFSPVFTLLFLGALFSKTVTCTLPVVCLLLRGLMDPEKGALRKEIIRQIPLLACGAVMGAVTVWWESARLGAGEAASHLSFADRILAAGRIPWFYLWKVLWPSGLYPIYPLWKLDPGQHAQWLFPLASLAVTGLLWFLRARIGSIWIAGWLGYLALLGPALGFIDFSTQDLSLVADHYQYLASLIPIAALGLLFQRLALKAAIPPVLVHGTQMVLCLLLGWLSWIQAGYYRDPVTFWSHGLAGNPECWVPHNNLGVALAERGRIEQAMTHYAEAIRLYPDFAEPQVNLGNAYNSLGKIDQAHETYLKATKAPRGASSAWYRLGRLYDKEGNLPKAEESYKKAVEIRPRYPEALNSLGVLYAQTGRTLEAAEAFQSVLEIQPLHRNARENLRIAQMELKNNQKEQTPEASPR